MDSSAIRIPAGASCRIDIVAPMCKSSAPQAMHCPTTKKAASNGVMIVSPLGPFVEARIDAFHAATAIDRQTL
jgi:hypothetical protein